jgi:hypothetical protein
MRPIFEGDQKVNFSKLLEILVAMLLISELGGCSSAKDRELTGFFTGVDGSNHLPSQVDTQFSVTGDGLISGIWSSRGEIKSAKLFGAFGYFSNELQLHVENGDCQGEFKGAFSIRDGKLAGKFKDNPACPDRSYAFEFTKVK